MDEKHLWYGLKPPVYSFSNIIPQGEMNSICNLITEAVIFIDKYINCQYYPVPTYLVEKKAIKYIKALVGIYNGEFNEFEESGKLKMFECLKVILNDWFFDTILYYGHYNGKELVNLIEVEKNVYEFLEDPHRYFIHLMNRLEKFKISIVKLDDAQNFLECLQISIRLLEQKEGTSFPCNWFFKELAKDLRKDKTVSKFLKKKFEEREFVLKSAMEYAFLVLETLIDKILKLHSKQQFIAVKKIIDMPEFPASDQIGVALIPYVSEVMTNYGSFVPPGFWEKFGDYIPIIKKKMGIPANIQIPLFPCVFICPKAIGSRLKRFDIEGDWENRNLIYKNLLQLTIVHEHTHAALRHAIMTPKKDLKKTYEDQIELDEIRIKNKYIEEGFAEFITYEFIRNQISYRPTRFLETLEDHAMNLSLIEKIKDLKEENKPIDRFIITYPIVWPYVYMFIWKNEIEKEIKVHDLIIEWKVNPTSLIKKYPADKIKVIIKEWVKEIEISQQILEA